MKLDICTYTLQLGLWTLITIFAITTILSINVYYTNRIELIADMVSNGADPLRVTCALDTMSERPSPTCLTQDLK